MLKTDESRLAELRLAFLRQLPRRVESMARHLQRFRREGWDVNGLSVLHEDVQRLGNASGRYDLDQAGAQLRAIEDLLGARLTAQNLPDAPTTERLLGLVEGLADLLPAPPPDPANEAPPPVLGDTARVEVPPPNYWRRWAPDAPPSTPTAAPLEPPATATPAMKPPRKTKAPAGRTGAARSTAAPPPQTAPSAAARIYHLRGNDAGALELDQRLVDAGFELESLETSADLRELLSALPADLIVVDAVHSDELEAIGLALRPARQRGGHRTPLLALATIDDVTLRLNARRAGVDAVLVGPLDPSEVIKQIRHLLAPANESAFRILIVEDDRSQALFAEGVLRNAGMEPLVVSDSMQVLPAMESFRPDLVLMDLYMPQADGMELTALIREREAFLHTPIVFLSGESDPDKQFDALDAGGDDFLSKPVRPRHLISAVQNRVRRARSLARRSMARDARDPFTGLLDRTALLDRINTALDSTHVHYDEALPGGVLFLDIEGCVLLRERLGLSALEQLLVDAGRALAARLGMLPGARYGDGSFLVLAPERDGDALEVLAADLRRTIGQHPFVFESRPLKLTATVGICMLHPRFGDAGALLNAAERAARDARAQASGVRRYEPPQRPDELRVAWLLERMRDALEQDRFELIYQPIVAVAGGDEAQYQVLLRLRGEDGEVHSAGELVPLAEQAGLILEIDRWVIGQALTVLRQRRDENRPLRLFVTQSPMTLADTGQIEWLKSELAKYELPGTSLVIEVRLDDAAVHAATVQQFCEALVPDGIQSCLSQFDAGPDTDGLLESLPLGYVKLAPKFGAPSLTPAVRDELRVLIDRAHRRGLQVIGHRVEDAQSAATLWMSGIDYIQGNLVQQADRALDFDFQSAVL